MPELTLLHWIYLAVVCSVIGLMIFRRDVVLPCLIGIFIIGYLWNGSLIGGGQTVFKALEAAGTSLFDIMLVISLMVGMLKSLQSMGADYLMVSPAKKLMSKPAVAYWSLAGVMFLAATFFWPTPAVALVGTILIPVAIAAGLSPMAAAVALNLGGHGTALSADVVLQGAPNITARAADVDVALIVSKGALFGYVTGITALIVAFILLRKDIFSGKPQKNDLLAQEVPKAAPWYAKAFAIFVPIIFFSIVATMIRSNMNEAIPNIQGGDATSLLGGAAAIIMIIASVVHHKGAAFEKVVGFLREGFMFAIKIFAPVIPIAGFFFLGSPSDAAAILGEGAPGFMFDLGTALATSIPLGTVPLAFGIVLVGLMTGLDGSGFSGLPLVGSLAASLGGPTGVDVSTLAALGQVAAIWAGGGTLTAWAFGVVADAGIAGVKPMDLVRQNFIAVMSGLFVATILAIFMM
ncbi:MAG: hypothetical protein SCK28_08120 [Bacillota bacterium]|nr:hypothetical protein [Bacillota bacterium]